MTQDTEDVVARVAKAIANARHGAGTWQRLNDVECRDFEHQARAALEAADRQSLSDRIDVLEGVLGEIAATTDDFVLESIARAALHQEGS